MELQVDSLYTDKLKDDNGDFYKFVKRFLAGRINWWSVPRRGAIINFGNIISFVLYRQGQYQIELFIAPFTPSSFTSHRHPNVNTFEFPLSGDNIVYFDGVPVHSKEEIDLWLSGGSNTQPLHIPPSQYHSGTAYTPSAFLSIQMWLDGVTPTSVGLNWEGEPSSVIHEKMLNS